VYFFNSLKTNIATSLAILLLVAMLFIDFVMVVTAQKGFVRSELEKGRLFSSFVSMHIQDMSDPAPAEVKEAAKKKMEEFLESANISGVIIIDTDGHPLYQKDARGDELAKLRKMTLSSLHKETETVHLTGSTWGVFWRQRQMLSMAIPLFKDDKIAAGAGLLISLERFYQELRESQQLVIFYIILNTLILTCFGFYRMHKLSIKPIHRLVKRASEYSDKEHFVFKHDKEKSEFGHLSMALNRMLVRIADDREALQTSLSSLEKTNFQLKKARNEIIRAEKLASVGRLSAGIAHEIGNPIGIVLGYLELLKKETLSEEDRQDFIDRSINEIARINLIIRQLLDFSRPSVEKVGHVSAHEVISEVVDMLRVQPIMNTIRVDTLFYAEKDKVYADPNRLRQVFLNLMMNACDAILSGENKENGNLVIKTGIGATDDHNELLTIEFVDNGPGILPDDMVSIFDPFYTTKEPGKGTGLGLSVSYMIVEQIGGTIKVGDAGGAGTNMTVCLPFDKNHHGK